ncbi:hypothetical protein ACFHWD_04480 [Clostridium sp. MT-14]|uniref:hypothetical protein n=1 Tax=Clostridium sp. MT-14 TaxID=3348360 RepID=UPI0035F4D8D2
MGILNISAFQKDANKLLKIIFEGIATIGVKLFKFHKYMLSYKNRKNSCPFM